MGKECGTWVSRRLWGGGNTSTLKTTAWEAKVLTDVCHLFPLSSNKLKIDFLKALSNNIFPLYSSCYVGFGSLVKSPFQ